MTMNKHTKALGLSAALLIGGLGLPAALAQGTTDVTGTIEVPTEERDDDERFVDLAAITLQDAVDVARRHLGGDAVLSEIELDEENGYLVWEVTGGDQAVLVDAGSGEILATRQADVDAEEDASGAQVPLLDAVAAAQQAAGDGAPAHGAGLDDEGDRLVWEVEIGAREFEVDAATGEVTSTGERDD